MKPACGELLKERALSVDKLTEEREELYSFSSEFSNGLVVLLTHKKIPSTLYKSKENSIMTLEPSFSNIT